MWCNHPDFLLIVQDSFTTSTDILRATTCFTNRVSDWNKHVFSKIFHRKRQILARLAGIQKSNVYPFSNFLLELEANLQQEFSVILKSEEDFWKPKSRITWLSEGDANKTFFHISTVNRRRRNRILSLKDEVGNTIQDPQHIKDTIINYFIKIYATDHHCSKLHYNHIIDRANVLSSGEQDTIDPP